LKIVKSTQTVAEENASPKRDLLSRLGVVLKGQNAEENRLRGCSWWRSTL